MNVGVTGNTIDLLIVVHLLEEEYLRREESRRSSTYHQPIMEYVEPALHHGDNRVSRQENGP